MKTDQLMSEMLGCGLLKGFDAWTYWLLLVTLKPTAFSSTCSHWHGVLPKTMRSSNSGLNPLKQWAKWLLPRRTVLGILVISTEVRLKRVQLEGWGMGGKETFLQDRRKNRCLYVRDSLINQNLQGQKILLWDDFVLKFTLVFGNISGYIWFQWFWANHQGTLWGFSSNFHLQKNFKSMAE